MRRGAVRAYSCLRGGEVPGHNRQGRYMTETIVWPTKSRELHNHHFDSTMWNEFRFRNEDIIIASYAKAGTTWTQQIVAQMLLGPDPNLEVAEMSPWRVGPPIEEPPADIHQYFREWMERDGHPFWPFWENVRSWWEVRDLPNVMFVHFADLKRDMPNEMRRIAEFLKIPIEEARWEEILQYCTFDWMKRNAAKVVPLGGIAWDDGAQVFIHRGVNGRWTDTLTSEDVAEYEARVVQELGPECARWLATGELPGS